jgi:hypothetical protein
MSCDVQLTAAGHTARSTARRALSLSSSGGPEVASDRVQTASPSSSRVRQNITTGGGTVNTNATNDTSSKHKKAWWLVDT